MPKPKFSVEASDHKTVIARDLDNISSVTMRRTVGSADIMLSVHQASRSATVTVPLKTLEKAIEKVKV